MTDQLEVPQLCESAEKLEEVRQPRPMDCRPRGIDVISTQSQLLEAPRELPEGLDVGLGSFAEDALDEKRAQPAGGDDRGPQ